MTTSAGSLLGREHPASVLNAEVSRALSSHGGLVLVTGEAGIGKTTLVTEAVREARRAGALVLGGSCWDSAHAPGYWPWVQVIRGMRRALPPEQYAVAAPPDGGLAGLLGEAGTGGPDGRTFEIYDAVTTALVTAAQRRPVVVVLEDLHWADSASLRLLEFAVQHTWFERLLIIGTYRDVEVEFGATPVAEPPLTATALKASPFEASPFEAWPLEASPVAEPSVEAPSAAVRPAQGPPDSARSRGAVLGPLQSKATTITLTGLGREEVATLLARTAGREPGEALTAQVHERTGGNPFFVEQAARLWASGGTALAITPGVSEALRRRLSLLPPPVRELLVSAAVLGREFSRQVLAESVAAPAAQVDALLAQAVNGRLVTAEGGGRFCFAHDLFRETLYDSLSETGARERHAAAVRAGRRRRGGAGKPQLPPAELARHAYLAGAEIPADEAADLLSAAADDAHGRFAFDEALRHTRRAHEVAWRAGPDRIAPSRVVTVALELVSHLSQGNHLEEAAELYREVVERTRLVGDPALLARVALALYGNPGLGSGMSELRGEVLTEAHRALALGGGGEGAPDAAEMARIAEELTVRTETLARTVGDDEALMFVLWARHDAIWGLGTAAERERIVEELLTVLARRDEEMMRYVVSSLRWVCKLEQGDPAYDERYRSFLAAVDGPGVPPQITVAAAMDSAVICATRGRFEEAEAHLARMTVKAEGSYFTFLVDHHQWAIRLLKGEDAGAPEVADRLRAVRHPYPEVLLGIAALERGDTVAGLVHYASAEARAEDYPRAIHPLWLRFQAQAAAAAGDPELCERVRRQLAPHQDQWLVSFFGCDISGPVPYWLGVVEAADRRWDAAEAAFSGAIATADRMGVRPWALLARSRLSAVLAARDGRGADASVVRGADAAEVPGGTGSDAVRAARLRSEALAEAARLGMSDAVARLLPPEAGAGTDGDGGGAIAAVAGEVAPAAREFRRDGAVWQLTYAGRTVHLPDAKGLRDLRLLLGSPGSDVPAARLLAPEGGEEVAVAHGLGGDEVLDERARAAYKRRLETLDEEIDRATRLGQDERAAEHDRERQALLDELRAAAGLAGRSRRLGDDAERARKTVTARIRDTLRKLDARHPELARHLRASVSTGARCSYRPEDPTSWRL
ncbi:ATP-binding protein [Streptomyces otsuchiensis]|uniref:ATP-binding protein n=1 Tax=Streptomyces otsuchiensis TaxID=2681388 RepID=UPI001D131FE5|nr:AAA family ATPase [Streptomyces otsuchiensis]